MIKKYAVLGDPIDHSLSPEIYQLFAAQIGAQLEYERRCVAAGTLPEALKQFFEIERGCGVNITLPLKEEAFELVKISGKLTERAQKARALNIIMSDENGHWLGDNTDGVGLLNDLTKNNNIILNNQRILLLGAGGAARGVLGELIKAKPQALIIANRTFDRAKMLVEDKEFNKQAQSFSVELIAAELDVLKTAAFDLIIDATSASAQNKKLPLPKKFLGSPVYYVMMYGDKAKKVLTQAKQSGAVACIDGLGMLVEQAAENVRKYYLPAHVGLLNVKAVITALRDK